MAEPIIIDDWSIPAQSSPLADLLAVGAAFRELGTSVLFQPHGEDLSTINALLREILNQARKPLSADLTADPLACAILRQWARQPWQEAHRAALVDRMEETGRTEKETAWARQWATSGWYAEVPRWWEGWNRTIRRNATQMMASDLRKQFGAFEDLHFVGTEDTPSPTGGGG